MILVEENYDHTNFFGQLLIKLEINPQRSKTILKKFNNKLTNVNYNYNYWVPKEKQNDT